MHTTHGIREFAEAIGPYTAGSPGGPFFIANAETLPGEVPLVGVVIQFSPDPSFAAPDEVFQLTFGYHGAPPVAGDFSFGSCTATDIDSQDVTGLSCEVSNFVVLY